MLQSIGKIFILFGALILAFGFILLIAVEIEIEKKLGIKHKDEIVEYGIVKQWRFAPPAMRITVLDRLFFIKQPSRFQVLNYLGISIFNKLSSKINNFIRKIPAFIHRLKRRQIILSPHLIVFLSNCRSDMDYSSSILCADKVGLRKTKTGLYQEIDFGELRLTFGFVKTAVK